MDQLAGHLCTEISHFCNQYMNIDLEIAAQCGWRLIFQPPLVGRVYLGWADNFGFVPSHPAIDIGQGFWICKHISSFGTAG